MSRVSQKRRMDDWSSASGSEAEDNLGVKSIRVEDKLNKSSPSVFPCSLPPTCHSPHHRPQLFPTAAKLEAHQRTYHTHLCARHPVPLVFPDERFLVLHFRECHDPLLQLTRERGMKTFACFEYSCDRLFLTPKARRLHLIDSHDYPSTFHFALPNHGLAPFDHRHDPIVSLLRPQWEPRSHTSSPSSPSTLLNREIPSSPSEKPDPVCPMHIEPSHSSDSILSFNHPQSHPTPPLEVTQSEPTSAISLLSGFDRLSLVPRQVRLTRIASKSKQTRTAPNS